MPRNRRREPRPIKNLPAIIPPPPPDPEFLDRWGRNTKFRPEYVEQARILCEDGATDKELAIHFGVHRATIYDWRNNHPEFAAVCKYGKHLADERLERTAYEIACGYTTTVKESIKLRDERGNERIVELEKEIRIPPNEKMIQWLLKNRRPDVWKDKTELAHTGEVVHLTLEQARERLKAQIAEIKLKSLGTGEQAAG